MLNLNLNLNLTPSAAREIHESVEQPGNEDLGLRIAARFDGSGSVEYAMGFDVERDDDIAFVEKGINLLVGRSIAPLLDGTTLDFVEYQPGDYRFIFLPAAPKQAATGCGGSGCARCATRADPDGSQP